MKRFLSLVTALCLLTALVMTSGCTPSTDTSAATDSLATDAATDAATDDDAETTPLTEKRLSQIQEDIDQTLANRSFKGIAYIIYNGQVVYEKATAKANKEEDIDADINTVYPIGSVTKQFTATAIMLLYERGLLSLDSTIDAYFPDYENAKNITVDNLLTMRSGMINYTDYAEQIAVDTETDFMTNTARENRSVIEDYCLSHELNAEPGEVFEYSNTNYMLLGEIVEQLTGQTYHDFVQTEILDKAGMTSSGFLYTWERDDLVVAEGYGSSGFDFLDCGGIAFACGDLMTTAADMMKWADAVRNCTIISEESLALMAAAPDSGSYGYGFMVGDQGDVLYHNGYIPPFNSYFLLTRTDTPYTEVMIANHDSSVEATGGALFYSLFEDITAEL